MLGRKRVPLLLELDGRGHCPTCGQPLRRGDHLEPDNARLVMASGNAGITFETQGRCENEACSDFGSEFAPEEWLEPFGGEWGAR